MGKESAASEIEKTMKKWKQRFKSMCVCGIVWTFLALAALIVGIVMLVFFAKYWGTEDWQKGLAYFGVALLIFFIFALALAIIFFVILRIVYKRMNAPAGGTMKMFQPQAYAPGEAPYPQQPPPNAPEASPSSQPLNPGQPASAPPAEKHDDIHIEVSDNSKM